MPGGKLSPSQREKLRKEVRDRVTAGEKRTVVARELAAKYGVSPTAIFWHMGRELAAYVKRETRSSAGRKSGRRANSRQGRGAGMEDIQAEFERLLERDLEIRKAHALNLAGIQDLSLRVSKHLRWRRGSLKPLLPGGSGSRRGVPPGLQSFGSRLKELRKTRGMTLEDVARRAGTNKGYLSWIERGRFRPPSGKFVTRIARLFSIDERELHRLAYLEKAPPQIKEELLRAFWPGAGKVGNKGPSGSP